MRNFNAIAVLCVDRYVSCHQIGSHEGWIMTLPRNKILKDKISLKIFLGNQDLCFSNMAVHI